MPYNLLTLFRYLYISIDGSIFHLYYFYCLSIFQRTWRFVSKAGAKVSGLFLTAKLFSKFFQFFFSICFSGSLCERERSIEQENGVNRGTCESDRKDKDFYLYLPNFFGSFLFLFLSASAPSTVSHFFKAVLSWKAGAKVGAFRLRSKYITDFFSFIFGWVC